MMTSSLVALVVAFGSPSDFAAPSVFGGGGGLRFTGSPREKWDCGVCHVSEQPHTFTVVATGRDLATQGYVPGERYELEVETATPGKKNAFALEFTNRSGDPAGVVSVDPQTPHLCTSLTPEPVDPVEVIEGRVAMTYACEVAKWRVVWTAPAQDDGVVTLYASLVEGNGEDGSRGDVATTRSCSVFLRRRRWACGAVGARRCLAARWCCSRGLSWWCFAVASAGRSRSLRVGPWRVTLAGSPRALLVRRASWRVRPRSLLVRCASWRVA